MSVLHNPIALGCLLKNGFCGWVKGSLEAQAECVWWPVSLSSVLHIQTAILRSGKDLFQAIFTHCYFLLEVVWQ